MNSQEIDMINSPLEVDQKCGDSSPSSHFEPRLDIRDVACEYATWQTWIVCTPAGNRPRDT